MTMLDKLMTTDQIMMQGVESAVIQNIFSTLFHRMTTTHNPPTCEP
jgi:hypothetical protein